MCPEFGVDGIGGPFLRGDIFNQCIDLVLEGDNNGIKFFGDTANGFDILTKTGEHRISRIIAKHKRLTEHKPAVTFFFCLFKKLTAGRFVFIELDGVR